LYVNAFPFTFCRVDDFPCLLDCGQRSRYDSKKMSCRGL
jgi:hypothetical protein